MAKKEIIIGSIINIAMLVLGLILVFAPIAGLSTIVTILGVALIAIGVFTLVSIFITHSKEGSGSTVSGIVLTAAGVLLLIFSNQTAGLIMVIIPIVIGLWAVISGVLNVSRALQIKKLGAASWWIPMAFAVIYIVLGAIIIFNLDFTSNVISTLVGVYFIITGILGICSTGFTASYLKKYNL